MASEASPSVVTPIDEERLSMSRYSDAASEFGRKLNLVGSARADDMAAQTRAQARKDSQRPSSSRVAATNPSRSTGGAVAESSRRQSARLAANKGEDPARRGAEDEDDDSDDTEDDEDDDDDDPNPEAPQTPAPARPTARDYVLAIWAAFEPRDLSPSEFRDTDIGRLQEPSLTFRNSVEAIALNTRTNEDLGRLLAANPINGTFWGEQIVSKLQRRADRTFSAFRGLKQDAIETLEDVQRISASVAEIFRRPLLNTMHADSKARLIGLLTYMLDQIVAHVNDYRASGTAATPAYVGDQNEYILYLRFATVRANWSTYLNTMRELEPVVGVRALLLQPSAVDNLRQTYRRLQLMYPNMVFPSDSVRDFVDRFRRFLQNLRIIA